MVKLDELPGEIISEICTFLLEKKDLQSLRLCNKRLKASTAFAFDDRHFGAVKSEIQATALVSRDTLKLMITRKSLKTLIAVSKRERFQRAVKELEIYTLTFCNTTRARITGQPLTAEEHEELETIAEIHKLAPSEYKWPKDRERNPHPESRPSVVAEFERRLKLKRRSLHDQHRHDQNTMRTQGIDVELLAKALKNLTAVKSIRTTIDHIDMKHAPFGAKKLFDEIGVLPSIQNSCSPSRVVEIHSIGLVFGAMLRSGCQLEKLNFHALPYYLPLAKTETSRKASRTSTPAKTFARDQISKLNLSKIQSFPFATLPVRQRPSFSSKIGEPLDWATTLIDRMTSLRKLEIKGVNTLADTDLLYQLISDNMSLPRVHTVELSNLAFTLSDFEKLLRKVDGTLKTLKCDNCWAKGAKSEQILWALAKLPKLARVKLYLCCPRTGLQMRRTIAGDTPEEFRKELNEITYELDYRPKNP